MKNIKKRKLKGFTLIELIIVIAILAILVAIAVPKYKNSKTKSLITAHNSNVKVLESAAMTYIANGGGETVWENANDAIEYVAKYPKVPQGLKELGEGGKDYIVTIGQDGEITVKPGLINIDEEVKK